MSVEVVVPRGGSDPDRTAAWGWVRRRYAAHHPAWKLVEAWGPGGPWCKGRAVNPAVEAGSAEVIVVADADVWCDGLERAVMAIVCGLASWAVPHKMVRRLDADGTAAVLAGEDPAGVRQLAQRPYEGIWGGGIVVARREALLAAPLDELFVGWGQEDEAWALALTCLHGRGWRGAADLHHLWHPPPPRLSRRRGSSGGWARYSRYRAARRNPEAMTALLEEARCQPSG